MAIKFVREKKKQKYLILILGIILLITGIILWLGFFREKKLAPSAIVIPPREIRINFGLLESPVLKELQSFEEIFLFEAEPGRENPFLVY